MLEHRPRPHNEAPSAAVAMQGSSSHDRLKSTCGSIIGHGPTARCTHLCSGQRCSVRCSPAAPTSTTGRDSYVEPSLLRSHCPQCTGQIAGLSILSAPHCNRGNPLATTCIRAPQRLQTQSRCRAAQLRGRAACSSRVPCPSDCTTSKRLTALERCLLSILAMPAVMGSICFPCQQHCQQTGCLNPLRPCARPQRPRLW